MSGYVYNDAPAELVGGEVDLDDGANADWTKQGWDLFGVTDVDSLRGYLQEVGQRPVDFKDSVLYRANVGTQEWLRAAVAQLIRE